MKELKVRGLFSHIRGLLLNEKSLRGNSAVPDGEGLIDQNSYNVIEVDRLLDVVDHAKTLVGKDRIHKVFLEERLTLEEIEAKQKALVEIANDETLRKKLELLLDKAAKHEKSFYRFILSDSVGYMVSPHQKKLEVSGYGYNLYRKGTKFLPEVVEDVNALKKPESAYIQDITNEIKNFSSTRPFQLMKGPVYSWFGKLYLKHEKKGRPAIKLRLSLFKPLLMAAILAMIAAMFIFTPDFFSGLGRLILVLLLPMALVFFYVPTVSEFDKYTFFIPLKRLFSSSKEVEKAVNAVGRLDELLSYHYYASNNVHATVLPTMVASTDQHIKVDDAVNPVLGFQDEAYVANDFDASKHNLAFFTGANSGGKTAFCKTLAQIQLLSQAGCYVPARAATLTIADRVYYQTPEINSLGNDVGRFGTELKRTRDILIDATRNSLVILDELAEGTTHKEKVEISLMILNAFKRLGAMTVLVTHNHELAELYLENNTAIFRQVEFDGEQATHRFLDGISVISHAHLVASSVGFSKDDIERILEEKLAVVSS